MMKLETLISLLNSIKSHSPDGASVRLSVTAHDDRDGDFVYSAYASRIVIDSEGLVSIAGDEE